MSGYLTEQTFERFCFALLYNAGFCVERKSGRRMWCDVTGVDSRYRLLVCWLSFDRRHRIAHSGQRQSLPPSIGSPWVDWCRNCDRYGAHDIVQTTTLPYSACLVTSQFLHPYLIILLSDNDANNLPNVYFSHLFSI